MVKLGVKLLQIFQKSPKILEGLLNLWFKKEGIEKIANSRLEICKACPAIDLTGKSCAVPGTQPCCSHCGCSLGVMTRSLSSECSDPEVKKWKAVISQTLEDKHYEKIKYNPEEKI